MNQGFTKLYGDYLFAENRYEEAGFAYEFLREFDLASTAYLKAGLWRECLFAASEAKYDRAAMTNLCQSLARDLHEAKNYEAEATVYWEYLDDASEAIRLLCKANAYQEAMRVVC